MLKIQSLGTPQLERNGRRVRLNVGMAVAIEVICYFIQHEERSIDAVLHDIFTHSTPDQGRRYFHLIRHDRITGWATLTLRRR